FGMSNIGPFSLSRRNSRPVFIGRGIPKNTNYSEMTLTKIDNQLQKLVEECYKQAYLILSENRFLIDLLADELIENEVIEGKDFTRWVNSYIPPNNILKYQSNLKYLEENDIDSITN
ncbi:MAG: hypothetical protein AAFR30_17835, partial [Cyanobacteria bacterium J06628_4]